MTKTSAPPGFLEIKVEPNYFAASIDEMRQMSPLGYSNYIVPDLIYQDHHDIVRASAGDYPLATTPAQIDALISLLQSMKQRMKDAGL